MNLPLHRLLGASCFSFFCALTLTTNAQNILGNGGFESYSSCPNSVAQISNATGWATPSGHGGSADYMNTCASGQVGVPSNAFGSQMPHSGNGYMGFALYYQSTPQFREYTYRLLNSPLVTGTNYTIQLWVSMADNSVYATDDLQFYFSNTPPTWSGGWAPMTTYTPQAALPSGTWMSNKTGWSLVSTTFTATGNHSYVTFGNFLNDASTSTSNQGAASYTTAYIYIDDAEISPTIILGAELDGLAAQAAGRDVQLSWETVSEDNLDRFEVERSVDGLLTWQKVGEVRAAGNSDAVKGYSLRDTRAIGGIENHYRLRLVDLDGQVSYSNAVSAVPEVTTDYLAGVRPNPVVPGQALNATFVATGEKALEVLMIDMQGREVYRASVPCQRGENVIVVPTEDLKPGNYLLRMTGGEEMVVQRVVCLN